MRLLTMSFFFKSYLNSENIKILQSDLYKHDCINEVTIPHKGDIIIEYSPNSSNNYDDIEMFIQVSINRILISQAYYNSSQGKEKINTVSNKVILIINMLYQQIIAYSRNYREIKTMGNTLSIIKATFGRIYIQNIALKTNSVSVVSCKHVMSYNRISITGSDNDFLTQDFIYLIEFLNSEPCLIAVELLNNYVLVVHCQSIYLAEMKQKIINYMKEKLTLSNVRVMKI